MTDDADFAWIEGPEDADWIKTVGWDLPTEFRQLVLTLHPAPDLKQQKAALAQLMSLDAWVAAPQQIKAEAAAFMANSTPIT